MLTVCRQKCLISCRNIGFSNVRMRFLDMFRCNDVEFSCHFANFMDMDPKATKFDQNHVQAYYNLGRILKLQEKYLLAIENFEKAIKLKPNYVEPYLGLGNLYLKLKKNRIGC